MPRINEQAAPQGSEGIEAMRFCYIPPKLPHRYTWFNVAAPGVASAPYITQNTGGQASTVEATSEQLVATPFTANYFAFRCATAVPGVSYVCTVRKNGADTALTFTVGVGATSGSDAAHSVAFAQGDRISISCVQSGTAAQGSWNGHFVVAGNS